MMNPSIILQPLIFKSLWDEFTQTTAFKYFVLIVIYQCIFEIIRIFFSHLINQDLWSLNDMNIGAIIQNSILHFVLVTAIYHLHLRIAVIVDKISKINKVDIKQLIYELIHQPKYSNLTSQEKAKLLVDSLTQGIETGQKYVGITFAILLFASVTLSFLFSFNILLILSFVTLLLPFILIYYLNLLWSYQEKMELEPRDLRGFVSHFLLTDFDESYWNKYDKNIKQELSNMYRVYLFSLNLIIILFSFIFQTI